MLPISQSFKTTTNRVPTFHCRTDYFKNSFFPSTLSDWFKLDVTIRNSESIATFQSWLLSFICLVPRNVCNIFDPIGLKLLTRLPLGFSHFNEHRFRHNFQDCVNLLCSCSLKIENTLHYLLHCHHFSQNRIVPMNSVKSASKHFNSLPDNVRNEKKKNVLEATLSYIKCTERFSESISD